MPIPPQYRYEKLDPSEGDAPVDQLQLLMTDLERLPSRTGFQVWYPPQVLAAAK